VRLWSIGPGWLELVENAAQTPGDFAADDRPAGGPSSAPSIGIVGGGQLAWMLAREAADLGVELHVQTPSPQDPAVRLATSVVLADVQDVAATRQLAGRCGAISFENEWIPIPALSTLRDEGVNFVPGLHALEPLVCKRAQRQLLDRLHLPCPRWCPLEAALIPSAERQRLRLQQGSGGSEARLAVDSGALLLRQPSGPQLPEGFRFPVMAKACSGGYDGKGTRPLASQAELEALAEEVPAADWILEEMVAFEQELALVACRDGEGNVACYPLVQTQQHQQVCDWVLAPAPVSHAVEAFARNVAASLLTSLDYVGILSIEFFYGPAGLQVNELAPRTHNSGHYTIEACRCSQFAQQVRIVAGLPMGSTEPKVDGALMVNLLGFDTGETDLTPKLKALEALSGAYLHWYGKQEVRPGRKLGHLTVVLEGESPEQRTAAAMARLEEVRNLWPLPPNPLE
jgi:5-(carboxyamino)imidazole ribonucleotide synthase